MRFLLLSFSLLVGLNQVVGRSAAWTWLQEDNNNMNHNNNDFNKFGAVGNEWFDPSYFYDDPVDDRSLNVHNGRFGYGFGEDMLGSEENAHNDDAREIEEKESSEEQEQNIKALEEDLNNRKSGENEDEGNIHSFLNALMGSFPFAEITAGSEENVIHNSDDDDGDNKSNKSTESSADNGEKYADEFKHYLSRLKEQGPKLISCYGPRRSDDNSGVDVNTDATTTTPRSDSGFYDGSDSDEDDDGSDDRTTTVRNEINKYDDELNFVPVKFHGIGSDRLNNHKYQVLKNSDSELKPTSAPVHSATSHSSDSRDNDHLNNHKYHVLTNSDSDLKPTSAPVHLSHLEASLRSDIQDIYAGLEMQVVSLSKSKVELERDFSANIVNNYDEDSLKKFEDDIHFWHENLDKTKRYINALQNIHTKMYLRSLVAAAFDEIQTKSKK